MKKYTGYLGLEMPRNRKEWLAVIKLALAGIGAAALSFAVSNPVPGLLASACAVTHAVASLPQFKVGGRMVALFSVHAFCALCAGAFILLENLYVILPAEASTNTSLYIYTLFGVILSAISLTASRLLDPPDNSTRLQPAIPDRP